jgi:hypothetical protein
VSTTLVANLPLVAHFATGNPGAVDTGGKLATGVTDTGGKFLSSVKDTCGK